MCVQFSDAILLPRATTDVRVCPSAQLLLPCATTDVLVCPSAQALYRTSVAATAAATSMGSGGVPSGAEHLMSPAGAYTGPLFGSM